MKIIYPQKITEDDDVVSTNLVDTRYDEWDDEGMYEREDRVRISDERSEYQSLTDHNNGAQVRYMFGTVGTRSSSGGPTTALSTPPTIKRYTLDDDFQVLDDETTDLQLEVDSSIITGATTLRAGGVAYDAARDFLWVGLNYTTTARAVPYKRFGPNLAWQRGREIALSSLTNATQNMALDVVGDRLYQYVSPSGSIDGFIKVYDITSSGGTYRSGDDIEIDRQDATRVPLGFAIIKEYAFVLKAVSNSVREVRVYSLSSGNEVTGDIIDEPSSVTDGFITLAGESEDSRLYIFTSDKGYAFDIVGSEASRNFGADIGNFSIGNQLGFDLSLNTLAMIHNPADEHRAIESAFIPDPDPRNWVRIGATMPWRLFDELPTQRAERGSSIQTKVKLAGPIDAVALIGLEDCTEVNITIDRSGTEQHNEDYSITASDVQTTWDHVLDGQTASNLLVTNIPSSLQADDEMEVTLTGGNDLACGQLVFGPEIEIGDDGLVPRHSNVSDFGASAVEEDILGDTRVKEGLNAQIFSMAFTLNVEDVGKMLNILNVLKRSQRALWIGSEEDNVRGWTYGFFRDYRLSYPSQTQAIMTLVIQELL